MSQPGRYLHLLEPIAQPVTVREFDTWRGQDTPPHTDTTGSDERSGRRLATRAGLIVVLATLVCCSGAWMAVTVRLIARIYNG